MTGFHALRHHLASALADDGAVPVNVAEQLGHATPATTREIYTHGRGPVATAAVDYGAALLGG